MSNREIFPVHRTKYPNSVEFLANTDILENILSTEQISSQHWKTFSPEQNIFGTEHNISSTDQTMPHTIFQGQSKKSRYRA